MKISIFDIIVVHTCSCLQKVLEIGKYSILQEKLANGAFNHKTALSTYIYLYLYSCFTIKNKINSYLYNIINFLFKINHDHIFIV